MIERDAYDHAVSLWGADAGVWRIPACLDAPARCVVGRWIPIAETAPSPAGMLLVLRTSRRAFVVLGEGRDWSAAFADAQAKRLMLERELKLGAL